MKRNYDLQLSVLSTMQCRYSYRDNFLKFSCKSLKPTVPVKDGSGRTVETDEKLNLGISVDFIVVNQAEYNRQTVTRMGKLTESNDSTQLTIL
jgi:hypothetical protein